MHATPVAHLVGAVGVHDKGADEEEEDAGGQHGQHGGGAPADEQLAHTPAEQTEGERGAAQGQVQWWGQAQTHRTG